MVLNDVIKEYGVLYENIFPGVLNCWNKIKKEG
jgi:hypothetical protein